MLKLTVLFVLELFWLNRAYGACSSSILTHGSSMGKAGTESATGIKAGGTGLTGSQSKLFNFATKGFCEKACDLSPNCISFSIPPTAFGDSGCNVYTAVVSSALETGDDNLYRCGEILPPSTTPPPTTPPPTTPPPTTPPPTTPPPTAPPSTTPPTSPPTTIPGTICTWLTVPNIKPDAPGMAAVSKQRLFLTQEICASQCLNNPELMSTGKCDGYSYGTTGNLALDKCYLYSGIDDSKVVPGNDNLYLKICLPPTTTTTTTTTSTTPPPTPGPTTTRDPNAVCTLQLYMGVDPLTPGLSLERVERSSVTDDMCKEYCMNNQLLQHGPCDAYSYGTAQNLVVDKCYLYSGVDKSKIEMGSGTYGFITHTCVTTTAPPSTTSTTTLTPPITTTTSTTSTTTTTTPPPCKWKPVVTEVDAWPALAGTQWIIVPKAPNCEASCVNHTSPFKCKYFATAGPGEQCYLYGDLIEVDRVAESEIKLHAYVCNGADPTFVLCNWVNTTQNVDPAAVTGTPREDQYVKNEPHCQKLCHFGAFLGRSVCHAYLYKPPNSCILVNATLPITATAGSGDHDLFTQKCV